MKIASIILALAACSTLTACVEDNYDSGNNTGYARADGPERTPVVKRNQGNGGTR